MAHEVFVSYGHRDKPVADAVCARLEARGIRCWIAPRDVVPGAEYGEALSGAIRQARALVLVFSSHANLSTHVGKEVERAVSAGIPVVPFRIEDVAPSGALDFFIGSVHWLDALTPPLDRHIDHLADAVDRLLGTERSGRPSPRAPGPPRPAPGPGGTGRLRRLVLATVGIGVVGLAAWFVVPALLSRDPVVGCWIWPGGTVLRLERGGRVIGGVQEGRWRREKDRRYLVTWPFFEDRLSLAADGASATGTNNYGSPVGGRRSAPAPEGGGSFVGQWAYNTLPTTVHADGSIVAGPFRGSWTATGEGSVTIVWTHRFVDDLALVPAGDRLAGSNNYGLELTATRGGC